MSNKAKYTSIPVRPEVRDSIRRLKREQETYSELLARMEELYELVEGTSRQDPIDEVHQDI